jgi:hypothetical protein
MLSKIYGSVFRSFCFKKFIRLPFATSERNGEDPEYLSLSDLVVIAF